MSNELDHQAFLYRRSGTVHFQMWFTSAARGPGAKFLPFPAKKHKTQCQSYSIWFPRKLPKKSRRLPREDYRRHRVPDLSKFLLGFILRLRARPFDQPADDRILRKLLGCVVEEIRFWHCVGAFALANCKYRIKFPLSGGSVISRHYRSNPPY